MLNHEIGKRGELLAQKHLKEAGYEIITVNYRCRLGEIDIIASKDNYIIFIEVKTRRNNNYGLPYESVSTVKQKRIRKVAAYYLKVNNIFQGDCRFDVVSIERNGMDYICEIIQDAF
ncbi:MAG: YraN family protein [Clostridia bacterium]|nr:YraN family protein [Clostridia bacterium]